MELLNQQEIETVFERFKSRNPEPKSELNWTSPFTLLVAVVLSAQATDKSVNNATKSLFAIADTPRKMLALGEEGLIPYIKSIGLYRSKASHVIGLSRVLLEKFGGEVPDSREELMILPGVGRKTANVVLANAFGQPAFAVDTHVFRVSNRIGLAHASNVQETERQLMAAVPRERWSHTHHLLIWHGRRCCAARKPACERCPIVQCEYRNGGNEEK